MQVIQIIGIKNVDLKSTYYGEGTDTDIITLYLTEYYGENFVEELRLAGTIDNMVEMFLDNVYQSKDDIILSHNVLAGEYINFNPEYGILELTQEGLLFVADRLSCGDSDESIIVELFEDIYCNSEWSYVSGHYGYDDYTTFPTFTTLDIDNMFPIADSIAWYQGDYAIKSLLDKLVLQDYVKLDKHRF